MHGIKSAAVSSGVRNFSEISRTYANERECSETTDKEIADLSAFLRPGPSCWHASPYLQRFTLGPHTKPAVEAEKSEAETEAQYAISG